MNREVIPVRRCSSRSGTAGCSGRYELVHCVGEVATICFVTNLISSRTLGEGNAAGYICRLASLPLWQELTVDDDHSLHRTPSHITFQTDLVYITHTWDY